MPCIIFGRISGTDLVVGNITVNITNTTRVSSLTAVTNHYGDYAVDAENFPMGYVIGDSIEVSVSNDMPVHDSNIMVDNGRIEII